MELFSDLQMERILDIATALMDGGYLMKADLYHITSIPQCHGNTCYAFPMKIWKEFYNIS